MARTAPPVVLVLVLVHVLVLVLALGGCAHSRGQAYDQDFAVAHRAETAGRFTDASAAYDEAAKVAARDRDRDEARYLAGVMLLLAGDVRDGVARLTPIAEATPPQEESAIAAYRIAEAHLDHGDPERGWGEMERIVARFPSSGVAHPALQRVLMHDDETKGKAASLAYLKSLEKGPLADSEVGELIAYEAALRMRDTGDHQGARDAFIAMAQRWPYPHGTLFDDALYHASEEDERLGRYQEATADLRLLLQEREVVGPFVALRPNNMFGSYQRRRMTPAQIRLAYLLAMRLGDRAGARDVLHTLYADFKTSDRRAEALWLEAELWRDDGDPATSCDRLATLVQDFPDSRYVPCSHDVCATVALPEKSGAPKSCHAYLILPHRFHGAELPP
jgi:TolA-binding protein